MARIYSPNKQYNGISATVDFTQGVGECADPHLIEWFKEKGYTVEAAELIPDPIKEEVKRETPKKKTTKTKSE